MLRNIVIATAAAAVSATLPTFPNDWYAVVDSEVQQAQGDFNGPEGSLCCAADSVNCQIQIQSQDGPTYVSVTQQATAQFFADGTGIVSLYNSTIAMECAVDNTMTCTSYCPLSGKLTPYSVSGYDDMGPTTWDGQHVELWQSTDVFPGLNITMETDNIYVNQADIKNAIPVYELDLLTPFGQPIGQMTTSYANFQGGPQPAAKFAVKGLASCPQDSGCNSQIHDPEASPLARRRQIYRHTTRQRELFWKSHVTAAAEKAAKQAQMARDVLQAMENKA